MKGNIRVTNQSASITVIDIEGIIGIPEDWQFDDPGERIATYETFQSVLKTIKEVNTSQIIVNIRSVGGNVNDALLIYDALRSLNVDIITRCFGYVASAATIIAQAASIGKREISANSLYLIHGAICSAEGNSKILESSLEMLNKTDERIAAVYAERSGRDIEDFKELMTENNGSGKWLSPDETIQYGLVDHIIEQLSYEKNDKCENALKPDGILKGKFHKAESKVMNIKRQLHKLLEVFNAILPAVNMIDEYPQGKKADKSAEIVNSDYLNTIVDQEKRIFELKNRISFLEANNAKLSATATLTKPKEDPSPQDAYISQNHEAYINDIRNFK